MRLCTCVSICTHESVTVSVSLSLRSELRQCLLDWGVRPIYLQEECALSLKFLIYTQLVTCSVADFVASKGYFGA